MYDLRRIPYLRGYWVLWVLQKHKLSTSTTRPKKVQFFRIDLIHKAKKFRVLPLAI